MSLRLKALGLFLLAAAAMSSATGGSSANTGGHFVSEVTHTIVNQTSSLESTHSLELGVAGLTGIVCDEATASGTANSSTVTEAMGSLTLAKCHTTGGAVGAVTVHLNGCEARLTVASGDPSKTEQTDDFVCPAGKVIEITHEGCVMKIPPQNNISGFTYTPVVVNGKNSVTADVNAQFELRFEAGFCILLGTKHTAQVTGSTIVRGYDTLGNQVGITAT